MNTLEHIEFQFYTEPKLYENNNFRDTIYGTIIAFDKVNKQEACELTFAVFDDHIYFEHIRVYDDYRNQGLAKLTYKTFENYIKQFDKQIIKLIAIALDKISDGDPVDGDLSRLVKLYESFGFQIQENRNDSIDMFKTLT